MSSTPIQNFYKDQTVLITGGTGFLGKLTVEKLLRTCDPKKIILLVRPKRDKTQEQRFREIFDNVCFRSLRESRPDFADKVRLMCGDCGAPMLGLSEQDVALLQKEVTCVIHAAANVRFDQGMRPMIYTNVRSVRDLLEIAKGAPQLRAFVYVSTAFSNCPNNNIEERFYDPPMDSQKLLVLADTVNDDLFENVTPMLLQSWPNTYCYTKTIAEDIMRKDHFVPNKVIVRPGIVISTAKEPLPGWIDNLHGIVGLVIGIALGVLRSINIELSHKANIVPADYTVNSILAAAWNAERASNEPINKDQVAIYNYAGSDDNVLLWRDMFSQLGKNSWTYPTNAMLWYTCYWGTSNKVLHKISVFFLHTVFAYIVDGLFLCIGRKPMAVRKYEKIDKLMEVLSYFSLGEWNFSDKNVQRLWKNMSKEDRELFFFNMKDLNWDTFFVNCLVGGRIHVLNDPLETIPKAKRKLLILGIIHYSIAALLVYALYKILSTIVYIFI